MSPPQSHYLQRKLRLFLCACFEVENEGVRDQLTHAIELDVARRYTDGLATSDDLWNAHIRITSPWSSCPDDLIPHDVLLADSFVQEQIRVKDVIRLLSGHPVSSILRDIVYNPFAGAILDQRPFPCTHESVHQLATSIYHNRLFSDLPILGDALIDAGYTNTRLLDHCRTPEPHYCGCWVLDLLLREDCAEVLRGA